MDRQIARCVALLAGHGAVLLQLLPLAQGGPPFSVAVLLGSFAASLGLGFAFWPLVLTKADTPGRFSWYLEAFSAGMFAGILAGWLYLTFWLERST